MEWGALSVSVVVVVLAAAFVWTLRARASGAEVLTQLRALTREMTRRAAVLERARRAAAESEARADARRAEVEASRREMAALRGSCSRLCNKVDALNAEVQRRSDAERELRLRLDEANRARVRLSKQLADSEARSLEVTARCGFDDVSRVNALNRLRRPAAFLYPSDDSRDASSSDLVEVSRAPARLPKTPSETYLLSLQPNLSASDSDSDADQRGGGGGGGGGGSGGDVLGGTAKGVLVNGVARVSPELARPKMSEGSAGGGGGGSGGGGGVSRHRRRRSAQTKPLSLLHAPWADALPAGTPLSVAAAAAPGEMLGVGARRATTPPTTVRGIDS